MLHLLGSEAATTCDLDRRTDLPHCDRRTFVFRDVLGFSQQKVIEVI
jgi:hypothetical protein